MTTSVIIPSLYEVDGEYLKLCVESLQATTDWQIIVVTNGSKHKPILPFTCHHIHTSDQGQCNAVNIGAQVATGDYLFISNADMYYAHTWKRNLRFDHPVFSPNLVEPTNNHGSATPFLKVNGGFTLEEFNKDEVDWSIDSHTELYKDNVPPPGEFPKEEPGFNFPLFIKADFWRMLGGYDVAYDPWGSNSDTDLQTRINLAGVTPMRLRDVLVYHFSNKTPTFAPENNEFRMFNFDYFKEKFGFDRDELNSDVWYNKDMLPTDDRNKYKQEKYNG